MRFALVTGPLPGGEGELEQKRHRVLPSLEGRKGWVKSGLWVVMGNPGGENSVRVLFHAVLCPFSSVYDYGDDHG